MKKYEVYAGYKYLHIRHKRSLKKNYTDDDVKNIELFYEYFERKVSEEISKYDCKNESLKRMLNIM